MNPAVLIIDMLNDFFKEKGLQEKRGRLVERINDINDWARKRKVPVIWVRQEFEPDLSDAFLNMRKKDIRITIKGTGGERILPELLIQASDNEIVKKRYSAFFKTELADLLARLQVDTLILAGINTHACIRMTAIDAYQQDYEVIIAKECVSSYDLKHHEVTLDYVSKGIATLKSNEEIKST